MQGRGSSQGPSICTIIRRFHLLNEVMTSEQIRPSFSPLRESNGFMTSERKRGRALCDSALVQTPYIMRDLQEGDPSAPRKFKRHFMFNYILEAFTEAMSEAVLLRLLVRLR